MQRAVMARWVVMAAGVALAAIAVRNLFVPDLRSIVLILGAVAVIWLQIRRDPRGPRATFWLGVFAVVAAVYSLVFDKTGGGRVIAASELAAALVLCAGGSVMWRAAGRGAD